MTYIYWPRRTGVKSGWESQFGRLAFNWMWCPLYVTIMWQDKEDDVTVLARWSRRDLIHWARLRYARIMHRPY